MLKSNVVKGLRKTPAFFSHQSLRGKGGVIPPYPKQFGDWQEQDVDFESEDLFSLAWSARFLPQQSRKRNGGDFF